MTKDVRMKGFTHRSQVKEALDLIESRIRPLGLERVPFHHGIGRILAENIISDKNVPPHPKSAMDGYALRAEDTPGELKVVGELMANDRYQGELRPGQAVRIMTGAKVPDGADAVVMVEHTKLDGETLIIEQELKSSHHVLATGEDLKAGDAVLTTGRKLRPQDIAMLVSVNALEVLVYRKPRVRIIPTGTELTRVGSPQSDHKIVESNSYMLQGLANRDGADAIMHPIMQDNMDLLRSAITAPGADLIVMTGGSSVGKEDLGPVVVREIGELPIHGIHIKPGSPTGIGFINGTPIVLAPGYPVATLVAWDMFVRPIIQRLQSATPSMPYPYVAGKLRCAFKKPEVRMHLQRVTIEDGQVQVIKGGAALLSTATKADGFVVFEAGREHFDAQEEVRVYLYG
jgi:molybdopterin molybdotransferase